jgi:hypothetical protein
VPTPPPTPPPTPTPRADAAADAAAQDDAAAAHARADSSRQDQDQHAQAQHTHKQRAESEAANKYTTRQHARHPAGSRHRGPPVDRPAGHPAHLPRRRRRPSRRRRRVLREVPERSAADDVVQAVDARHAADGRSSKASVRHRAGRRVARCDQPRHWHCAIQSSPSAILNASSAQRRPATRPSRPKSSDCKPIADRLHLQRRVRLTITALPALDEPAEACGRKNVPARGDVFAALDYPDRLRGVLDARRGRGVCTSCRCSRCSCCDSCSSRALGELDAGAVLAQRRIVARTSEPRRSSCSGGRGSPRSSRLQLQRLTRPRNSGSCRASRGRLSPTSYVSVRTPRRTRRRS